MHFVVKSTIPPLMKCWASIRAWTSYDYVFQDKKDIPWWLGISNKGIGVYDKQDKNEPRRVRP